MARTKQIEADIKPDKGFPVPIELEELPPDRVNGKPNPDYYRARVRNLNRIFEEHISRGRSMPHYDTGRKGLHDEIKLAGFDPETIMDARSDSQRFEDAVTAMLKGERSMLEMDEDDIAALEKGMAFADDLCAKRVEDCVRKADREGYAPLTDAEIERLRKLGKVLRDRIRRVKTLRQRARNAIPPRTSRTDHLKVAGVEAAHTLRFMLYVGRSDDTSLGIDGTRVFRVSEHHAKMAVAYWEAKNGVRFCRGGFQRDIVRYEGVICVMPPRHSKTEYGLHDLCLDACHRPHDLQNIMLHNDGSVSEEMLGKCKNLFRRDNPAGRRREALFPGILVDKQDDNKGSMRLTTRDSLEAGGRAEKNRAPTMSAFGVRAGRSGLNANDIYIDDPVDEKARDEESTRDKTKRRIHNTWLARRQGYKHFFRWNATLWHEDDATADMIHKIRKGEVLAVAVIMGAGGPNDRFRPVWKDSPYDAAFFRRRYKAMGVRDYMTIYGCHPSSAESSIVPRIALYSSALPNGLPDPKHLQFLQGAKRYVSVDPAATKNAKSDRSGIVYAALGDIHTTLGDDQYRTAPRLRVLRAGRLRASPEQVVHFLEQLAMTEQVDEVHIETVSGFNTLADWVTDRLGCHVVRHSPAGQGRDKETRLKAVALMLDDSRRTEGVIPPVEFPGRWEGAAASCYDHPTADLSIEGSEARCSLCAKVVNRLVPDPDVEWLVQEIIKFGSVSSKDGVDAVTQLVKSLAHFLGNAEGAVTTIVRARAGVNDRMKREMDSWRASLKENAWDADQRDYAWHAACYN